MRVIHILRKLDPGEWSGTEVAIHRLFHGLREHGVNPVAYCPKINGHAVNDPLEAAGFPVKRFKAFVPIWGLPRTRKRQLVSVGGNLMSFDLVSALWREKGCSVMHVHTLGRLGGIGLTLAKQRRIPFVVTIHGGVLDLPEPLKQGFNSPNTSGWEWGKPLGWFFQSHRLFKDADAILTCNDKEATLLQKQLPRKRIVVQPHGVPTDIYRQDQKAAAHAAYPQIQNRQVVLCVGRIDPVKNQIWLLDQLPLIAQKHPRALLVLVGPCTDEAYGVRLKERVSALGVQDRVLLAGGLPAIDPRLIGLLQSASTLVLPSLSETFGLVVLEAWAAGTSVISARTSGPSALVAHGQNGWLFDLNRPEGFHTVLDWTLAYPEAAKEMAKRGTELSERYSVHSLAGRMKSLYERLIEEKHALRNYS